MLVNPELDYPIPYHPTWQILDSSKLQAYLQCPRSFFYRYVLGWTSDKPNNHLVFGTAWHKALEHVINNKMTKESADEAFFLHFLPSYREVFSEETDDLYYPKSPAMARIALHGYCDLYRSDTYELVASEISGVVPVSNEEVLHFRLDTVMRDSEGMLFALEHKTAGSVATQWKNSWPMSLQVGTYTHVLNCTYGPEKTWGVRINGVSFQKSGIKYERVPVRRSLDNMAAWLWNVNEIVGRIKADYTRLAECSPSDDVLECFAQNPTSCSSYSGCSNIDYCTAWANPLRRVSEPPVGVKIEWWNPADDDHNAKKVVDLSKGEKI
jgi:hypothetical protein